jgi:hypothetical protein
MAIARGPSDFGLHTFCASAGFIGVRSTIVRSLFATETITLLCRTSAMPTFDPRELGRENVPGTLGRTTESYEITLQPDPSAIADVLRVNAGVGRLF